MQRRLAITKVLTFIDEAADYILRVCADLDKSVKEEGLFITDLVKVFPKISKEELLKEIQTKIASYIPLAETIKKELDPFVIALDANAVEIDESNTFAYMREVWLGDLYGVNGLEALKELAKELKKKVEVELQDEDMLNALAASIALKK